MHNDASRHQCLCMSVTRQAIDRTTYATQRDKLREESTLAELAAHEARIEAFDAEGILGFAEHLVANAARLWVEGTLEPRQMIQRAIFPAGLPFDGKVVGTGVTCLAFMQLPASCGGRNGMASPMPASWNQIGPWLRQVDALRRAA